MFMTIYCDTTGLFSEEEMNRDNCCEMEFSEETVREWFETQYYGPEMPFEEWIADYYTADDTDGLYEFALDKGETPTFGIEGKFFVCNYETGTTLFGGSYDDCRSYARDRNWTAFYEGEEYDLAIYDCEGNCA